MKKNQIPVALRAFFMILAGAVILGFSERVSSNSEDKTGSEGALTEAQFHDNIGRIINGTGISQEDLAKVMSAAEQRKSESETASEYIENYMNTHFEAAPPSIASTNRVSIAAPGQSDLNMSAACNQTALKTLISSTIGYYYAFAIKCDGTYKYDAENYTGGSTVYVRAEAGNSILEAFILF